MTHKLTTIQKQWIKDIPKYPQANGRVCDGVGFCCLGVFAHTQVDEPWQLIEDGTSAVGEIVPQFYEVADDDNFYASTLAPRDTKNLGIHGFHGAFKDSTGRKTKLEFKGVPYTTLVGLNDSGTISPQEMADFIEIHAVNIFK